MKLSEKRVIRTFILVTILGSKGSSTFGNNLEGNISSVGVSPGNVYLNNIISIIWFTQNECY